jgi:hypothetical protein
MSPIEFMCRMAALIAPPRIPLLRYHGCLAAASAPRKLIAPTPTSDACEHRSKTEPAAATSAPQKPMNQLDPDPIAPRTARSARTSVYIP